MGALHKGHVSLVERARQENDCLVVSLFVNPTQFNDPRDLRNYPRDEKKDLSILEALHADFVFAPDTGEMYPEPEGDQRKFDLHPLDAVMEGKYRKNHFNGVAQIVTKLFDAIMPDRAYFGMKDFQQLVIIKRLVSILNYPIKIIPCPIVRDTDGMALSSRNVLLTPEHRTLGPIIHRILKEATGMKDRLSPRETERWVEEQFKKYPAFKFEYFQIVNDIDLRKIKTWSEKSNKVGCVAVHLGRVRLIDNIIFD
jgi:pantoate--beta-alanine ligase